MNDKRTKNIFSILLKQFLVGAIMFFIGLSIIFYAHGYKINLKNFKIIKTGIINLSSNQKEADVYINGIQVSKKTPFSFNYLPGFYNAEIKKEKYRTWKYRIEVKAEMVSSYKNIVLFKSNIIKDETSDQNVINQLNSPNDELFRGDSSIYYNGYEIWEGKNLVARFSNPIFKAIWYFDNYHIIYQQGNEIRVIEKNGTNDTPLVQLNSDSLTNFATDSSGNELSFKDSGKYYKAIIK